jgi:hypothetical protein
MKQTFQSFAFSFSFLLFFSGIIFSFTTCKPKGNGKWVLKVEAQTENFSSENEKSIEQIYLKRLTTLGIKAEDILMKPEGKIIDIEISGASNYPPLMINRIEKLLQAIGHLSFWKTYSVGELSSRLSACVLADSLEKPSLADLVIDQQRDSRSPCLFAAEPSDTASIILILNRWKSAGKLPQNLYYSWTINPASENSKALQLIALKSQINGKATLDKPTLIDVKAVMDRFTNNWEISMVMDGPTSFEWSRMTKANIGFSIAIVEDGHVFTYPTVQGEISGGISSITGNFTRKDVEELAAVLNAGALPFPMVITAQNFIP